ncbi:hypothetical protein [Deinococcus aquaticus]|uniref:hypothetical protein n=1 Tax=Deinococcus aquaticus TaxID=328692 RepID=UPI00361EC0EF
MSPDSTGPDGQPRNRRVAPAEYGAPLDLSFGAPQDAASAASSADGAGAEATDAGAARPRRVLSRRERVLRGRWRLRCWSAQGWAAGTRCP